MIDQSVNRQIIEDGLDRQNIATLNRRFMEINADRLERMRGSLPDRHQIFLDVLPLLFHTNHPMMPGYVSHHTPARISNYTPNKHDILVGKTVAKSFTMNWDPALEDEIYGIYIMGSVGTIAQSERSDLDIWICHKPSLGKEQINELTLKCNRITDWAEAMQLEVHFFVMNHEEFKGGKSLEMNAESSGSAQQALLLDEFYRTAIYIQGRIPIWWYVPCHSEEIYKEYTNTLLFRRYVPEEEVIDFGGLSTIPAGEFLGAGIWQLYKAIESPYKSVLKLLLLEAYVADYPDIHPLSQTYKTFVYHGELDIDGLDSYVMIYQRIEEYLLSRRQYKRLELARRCFYFKVNKPISRPPTSRARSWQRIILESLTEDWGWSYEKLQFLDSRKHWKAQAVAKERGKLVAELNHSYHVLMDFAKDIDEAHLINADELTILGRKLQAAFDRKTGKIEWINPGISGDISERVLLLKETHIDPVDDTSWSMFTQQTRIRQERTLTELRTSPSLVELLLWSYYNGIVTSNTQFDMESSFVSEHDVERLIQILSSWLPLPLPPISHQNFHQSATAEEILLLVNAGSQPTQKVDKNGFVVLSDNSNDPLRHGGHDNSQIEAVDMITRNSWNEINTARFHGENALLNVLKSFLELCLLGNDKVIPKLRVECIGRSYSANIGQRIEKWLREIIACFFKEHKTRDSRFVFQMGSLYYCMQIEREKPRIKTCASEGDLINHLEAEQRQYSSIVIDSHAQLQHPLKLITSIAKPKSINVFYRHDDSGLDTFIVDEKGSLQHQMIRGKRDHNPMKPLHRFLRSVIHRQAQSNPEFQADFGVFPVYFYEISKDRRDEFIAAPKNVAPDLNEIAQFGVKAVAHTGSENQLCFDFFIQDKALLMDEYGKQLFLETAKYIIQQRSSQKRYPVYITDLDLRQAAKIISPYAPLQIAHHLKVKAKLEYYLNRAIGNLLKI
ncbi:Adenylate cyclase [Thalassocella blandensis]|nr:Adenylate cyclase [Thalassocella blandensis]